MPEAHFDIPSVALPRFIKTISFEVIVATCSLVIHEWVVYGKHQTAALGQQTVEL
ncbi:hypothetical protein D3C71_2108890 [compost metagenome]